MAKRVDILAGRKIIVGVTGGIAAYKTAMVVSTLVQRGAEVRVVMTESATRFVTPLTFQTLTRQMVYTDPWQAAEKFQSAHISLADWGEACLVAPATANLIGKLAGGLADDLLSTTLLAIDLPVIIAPAMNTRMWNKLVVQNNVALLVDLGYRFVGPEAGRLACGTVGEGRMSEPEELVAAVENLLEDSDAGKCPPAGRAPSDKQNPLSKRGRLA
jgi:phosphopantothenoylcysteine decarboxylase/phosphopantothenate--cysteine ligase